MTSTGSSGPQPSSAAPSPLLLGPSGISQSLPWPNRADALGSSGGRGLGSGPGSPSLYFPLPSLRSAGKTWTLIKHLVPGWQVVRSGLCGCGYLRSMGRAWGPGVLPSKKLEGLRLLRTQREDLAPRNQSPAHPSIHSHLHA